MRKLIVFVVIAGALLIAGDAWARTTIEGRLASELQDSLGASGEIEVALGGFPFVVRALSGSIPSATTRMDTLTRKGVRFTDIRLTLSDIRFSLGLVLSGDLRTIKVGSGQGRASISATTISRAVARSGTEIDVEITDDEVRVSAGPISGVAEISVVGNDLILSADEFGRDLVVPLPRIVAGVTYGSVEVMDSSVELGFSLDDVRFTEL